MPEMSGPDLYNVLAEKHPDLPVLYVSGYIFDTKLHHSLHNEDNKFLQKPFTAEQFLFSINQALNRMLQGLV